MHVHVCVCCLPAALCKQTLATTAELLGVEVQNLENMLTLKVVPVLRGEVFTKRLGVKEAVRSRDAAVKSLYEVRNWRGLPLLTLALFLVIPGRHCSGAVYVVVRVFRSVVVRSDL